MSTNKINIEAVNARAREEETPMTKILSLEERFVANYLDGDKIQDGQMLSSRECLDAITAEREATAMRVRDEEAVEYNRIIDEIVAEYKDTGVAEERRKHCCCVIKDSQVIESCKMHADIAAAEREAGREEERANIPVSFLRLWINEDRKQPHQELVTNEDIMRFINIGYGK